MEWLAENWTTNSFEDRLNILVFMTTDYEIWKARIFSLYQQKQTSAVRILEEIQVNIIAITATWEKETRTQVKWQLAMEWSSPQTTLFGI